MKTVVAVTEAYLVEVDKLVEIVVDSLHYSHRLPAVNHEQGIVFKGFSVDFYLVVLP